MASAAHTGSARLDESKQPLAEEELRKMHAYWRAANYLSVGQIYLYANPLLHEPLKFEHIKPRLHGYPWLIHRLTYRRTNHDNFHVRGYKEEGTTTTPFDMTVLNDLDRFHLAGDVVDRVPRCSASAHISSSSCETSWLSISNTSANTETTYPKSGIGSGPLGHEDPCTQFGFQQSEEWDGNHADIQVRNSQGAHLEDRVEVASRSDAIVQLHTPMKGVKHCKRAKVGSLSLGLHASF
jgi:hypothetical protein